MSEPRPLTPADLFQLQFIQGAALSPDGSQIVYVLSTTDADDDKDVHHLWLLNVDTAVTRQLTHGNHNNTKPAWSPDGRQIAFLSTRNETSQIYLLPLQGGEARPLTELPQGVAGGPVWSPDGQTIAFSAIPTQEKPDEAAPYRVSRSVYRFDGIGYLDTAVQDIYIMPAAGGDVQQLTADEAMNTQPQWSPDGREILYYASMLPDVFDAYFPRVRIVNLAGEVRQVVSDDWGLAGGSAAWLPDGKQIAFTGVPAGRPIGTKNDLFVVNTRGNGTPQNRTEHYPYGVGGRLQSDFPSPGILAVPAVLAVSKDGRAAYIQAQRGGTVQLLRVALTGAEEVTAVLDGERSCLLLGLAQDNRSLLYGVSTIHNPLDLFLSDIEGGDEKRVTTVNSSHLANIRQPGVKQMVFAGQDGTEVEGWLLLPQTGTAPFPTVLYIHGGPHGAFGHIFHFDMQMLVGAGYAVLIVNHRASTGYGDEFATAIKGDWGNLDYGDLMAGVDEAIAQGWADPERLGVCGLSGGGNLSCWIVGQTDRFKAAVPENPVTNWVSFYGVSDIGVWFSVEELGGHPHEIPEIYARCSPITYAHRCTTPTLLIQGEHDWRCPAEQSEQFYSVLKANGCIVEMLRLPQGSHVGAIAGPPPLRRAQNAALLDWMNRYVLGHEAEDS